MSKLKIFFAAALFTFLTSTCLISTIAFATDGQGLELEEAEKLVLKVSETGFEPKTITLQKSDSSIFVVNSSKASLLTLKVDFKGRKSHCASPNLVFRDGVLTSKIPIGPKDFALFCIPDPGTYEIVAYGLTDKPVEAKVVAEK